MLFHVAPGRSPDVIESVASQAQATEASPHIWRLTPWKKTPLLSLYMIAACSFPFLQQQGVCLCLNNPVIAFITVCILVSNWDFTILIIHSMLPDLIRLSIYRSQQVSPFLDWFATILHVCDPCDSLILNLTKWSYTILSFSLSMTTYSHAIESIN